MSYSSLTDDYIPADDSNYTDGRLGYRICKITPHHMAGVLTGEECANIFQNPNRNASANYCIGIDGDIVCSVDEENRAWTSSNRNNDCQAITIEVSNCEYGEPWDISDESWDSLVNLCVDICKRYDFRLNYDGTPEGSLTRHDMFASTNCPGETLGGRFDELETTVNAILDGDEPQPTPEPQPQPGEQEYQNGSTPEPVYCNQYMTHQIGELSPYERCVCIGTYQGLFIVRYEVDGTRDSQGNFDEKIGFVAYDGIIN
jgi:hypothetical protein